MKKSKIGIRLSWRTIPSTCTSDTAPTGLNWTRSTVLSRLIFPLDSFTIKFSWSTERLGAYLPCPTGNRSRLWWEAKRTFWSSTSTFNWTSTCAPRASRTVPTSSRTTSARLQEDNQIWKCPRTDQTLSRWRWRQRRMLIRSSISYSQCSGLVVAMWRTPSSSPTRTMPCPWIWKHPTWVNCSKRQAPNVELFSIDFQDLRERLLRLQVTIQHRPKARFQQATVFQKQRYEIQLSNKLNKLG